MKLLPFYPYGMLVQQHVRYVDEHCFRTLAHRIVIFTMGVPSIRLMEARASLVLQVVHSSSSL